MDMHRYDDAVSIALAPVAARQPRLGRLPELLKALADPVRLRIAGLLAQRELCVCDLEALLGISQSMTSHHLAVLRRAGIVQARRDERDARWVYYRLDPVAAGEATTGLGKLLDITGFDATPAACPPE